MWFYVDPVDLAEGKIQKDKATNEGDRAGAVTKEPTEAMLLAGNWIICCGLPTQNWVEGLCAAPNCKCWHEFGKPLLTKAWKAMEKVRTATIETAARALVEKARVLSVNDIFLQYQPEFAALTVALAAAAKVEDAPSAVAKRLRQPLTKGTRMRRGWRGLAMNKVEADTYELCFLCGNATGRAGRGADSIYDDADDTGPYCPECWAQVDKLNAGDMATAESIMMRHDADMKLPSKVADALRDDIAATLASRTASERARNLAVIGLLSDYEAIEAANRELVAALGALAMICDGLKQLGYGNLKTGEPIQWSPDGALGEAKALVAKHAAVEHVKCEGEIAALRKELARVRSTP